MWGGGYLGWGMSHPFPGTPPRFPHMQLGCIQLSYIVIDSGGAELPAPLKHALSPNPASWSHDTVAPESLEKLCHRRVWANQTVTVWRPITPLNAVI